MTAAISLLIILSLSFLITRMATAALTLTGVSHDLARMQAVSAFTGVGFTTSESEWIVQHPVRRRVLILLMILGNAGIITAVSSLILSFAGVQQEKDILWRVLAIVLGIVILWMVALSPWVDRHLHHLMLWALSRWTKINVKDYAGLLQLSGDYSIRELPIPEGHWMADTPLEHLELPREGLTVLGIHRADGDYVGVPRGDTVIRGGDRVVIYGPDERMSEIDDRMRNTAGQQAHDDAVADQERRLEAQSRRESERERQKDGSAEKDQSADSQ
jgi:hypothetical protein